MVTAADSGAPRIDPDAADRNWPQINPEVFAAFIAERNELAAKLAEVEAERDERAKDALRAQRGWSRALDRAEAAEGERNAAERKLYERTDAGNEMYRRLAEVEAERDNAVENFRQYAERAKAYNDVATRRAEAAESRLAAVLAIEEGNVCPHGFEPGEPGCGCYMCRVRAAAAGDDR